MEFKVGDWWVNKYFGTPYRLTETIVGHPDRDSVVRWVVIGNWQVNIETARTEFELWQPKVGEWCWKDVELIRIEAIQDLGREDGLLTYTCATPSSGGGFRSSFKPEPFIGTLPSFLSN
jgi:hypothetical protein